MEKVLKSPKLFLKFWFDAFKEAIKLGWVVSVALSLLIPDLVIVAGQVDRLAHVSFITWVSKNPNLARLYCAATIALAYLAYAPYRKYKETQIDAFNRIKKMYDNLVEVVKERDVALKQLSDLSGLHGHILHVAYFQDVNNRDGVAVAFRITNRGEPTIADKWGLTFELDGSQFGFGPSHFRDGKFAISDNKGNILTIKSDDMLFNKIGITPIPKGGRASGFLVFLTKDITYDRLIAVRPRVTILFSDAFGHEYKAEAQGEGVSMALYEPGLDDPFAPILFRQAETIKRMVVAVGEKIRQGIEPPKALQLCKADELDNVAELIMLCDELVKNGYPHPFRGIKEHIPKEQWLVFLQEAKRRGWNLGNELETFDALWESYVTEKTKTTPPSPTPDMGASPH
jgi:hypothetical protein